MLSKSTARRQVGFNVLHLRIKNAKATTARQLSPGSRCHHGDRTNRLDARGSRRAERGNFRRYLITTRSHSSAHLRKICDTSPDTTPVHSPPYHIIRKHSAGCLQREAQSL